MSLSANDLQGESWWRFHPRVFVTDGPVIDIGCFGWDWISPFIGKKEIFGYDPQQVTCPSWAVLSHDAVGLCDGTMSWNVEGLGTGAFSSGKTSRIVNVISFSSLIERHKPSLIKMNVEGMEYSLLSGVRHPVADQLIVSFHGFFRKQWESLDSRIVSWLEEWYEPIQTHEEFNWWVFLKRY